MNMNKKIRVYSAVAALACGLSTLPATMARAQAAPSATSAEETASTITLETVLEAAYEHNPDIAAYRQKYLALSEIPAQARSLPDPMFSAGTMPSELQTKAGPVKGKAAISEKFPFYKKRKLRGEIAEKDAEVASQAWKAKVLEIASRVTRAYYEIYFLDRSIDILTEQAELLRHFSRVAERKYSIGRHPQTNVFRAQVELAKILNDLITLGQERISALSKLNWLLNRPSRKTLGKPHSPEYPEFKWKSDELASLALENRPELLALKALIGKSEAARKLAIKNYFPDLTLSFEQTFIGAGTTAMSYDGKAAQGVMIKLNLPIWFARLRAGVKEKESRKEAARFSYKDLSNRTVFQVDDLTIRLDTEARFVDLYRTTVLPQASAALKSAESGYEADTVTFLELLDSERSLLRFELEYERHLVNYAEKLADLERVLGVELD